ncbi:MAG: hypothetical protein JXA90_07380, partial [Planctomycetes bacterium]|nr:hypothetical protein [Planctomycetota bacterium]
AEGAAPAPAVGGPQPVEAPAGEPSASSSSVLWICGGLALASLVVCLALPVWVFVAGADAYEGRFAFYKHALLVATIVYFVTGVIFAMQWDRRRSAA